MKLQQPQYLIHQRESSDGLTYTATVCINDTVWGNGLGTNAKCAKAEAAKRSLQCFFPGSVDRTPEEFSTLIENYVRSPYDDLKIEDPRVIEACVKCGLPSPYHMLLEYLRRSGEYTYSTVNCEVHRLSRSKRELTMSVGKHTATVTCWDERRGRERASQVILKALNPAVTSWGTLVKLYGPGSVHTVTERQQEPTIPNLSEKERRQKLNLTILGKLKTEMLKLKATMGEKSPAVTEPLCEVSEPVTVST
jgi:hypothetical protein